MNLSTFYKLFYRHRFLKASIFLKIYIVLILPLKYLINLYFLEKKQNLDLLSKKKQFLFNKDLNYLFEYFNSDKGEKFKNQYNQPSKKDNKVISAHGYSKFYEDLFLKIKNENINILEIGSFYGNASAALYFYFKNAKIYGADINSDMFIYSSKRVSSFHVDSSSLNSIETNIINRKIKFKVIIEDASHMLKDQIISLFYLFPILESGGYFIIEELDFPEKREDMRLNQSFPDLKTILKNIQLQKEFNSPYLNDKIKSYFLENFHSINLYKGNFNEIAIIKKK